MIPRFCPHCLARLEDNRVSCAVTQCLKAQRKAAIENRGPSSIGVKPICGASVRDRVDLRTVFEDYDPDAIVKKVLKAHPGKFAKGDRVRFLPSIVKQHFTHSNWIGCLGTVKDIDLENKLIEVWIDREAYVRGCARATRRTCPFRA